MSGIRECSSTLYVGDGTHTNMHARTYARTHAHTASGLKKEKRTKLTSNFPNKSKFPMKGLGLGPGIPSSLKN